LIQRDGWDRRALCGVAELMMGQSPDSKFYSDDQVGLPFLQGCAEFGSRFPQHALYCSQRKKVAPAGSILFSVRAPVGKLNIADRDYIIGRGLAAIRGSAVSQRYLEHYLRYEEPRFRVASQGSTFEAINSSALNRWPIDFPTDGAEQSKIAEVLSTLDQAIEQTETLIAKYQRIQTGLIHDLFTRGIDEHGNLRSEQTHEFKDSALGRIPVEWNANALGNLLKVIDPNPSHRYPPSSDTGVPIVSTENFLGENEFDLTRAERVPFRVFEQQRTRCTFDPQDVVFARKGRIGLARPYGNERKVFSHTVVLLKPHSKALEPRFVLWSVRFQRFFLEIDKRMNSNSGVPTLGVGFIQAIPIVVPSLVEQQRIASVMDSAEDQAEEQSAIRGKLRRLKAGLTQDLLTGKRRVTALLPQPGVATA
jgi:type I restriction enzyme S subunit